MRGRGEGAHLILWPWRWALIWERALIRVWALIQGNTVFIKCLSLTTNEAFFVYYDRMLFFVFLKSKNKKAAALPFVLAAPLDPEKGMDSDYIENFVKSGCKFYFFSQTDKSVHAVFNRFTLCLCVQFKELAGDQLVWKPYGLPNLQAGMIYANKIPHWLYCIWNFKLHNIV